jgi:uncharacterized membrane protein YsdA (DUF1294 family)
MPLTAPVIVAAYLLLISLVTFAAFAWDKHCSRTGRQRIREETLLGMAAIGGTIGALIGQHWLRHKTRKEPFRTMLYMIAAVQALLVAAVWFISVGDIGLDASATIVLPISLP